VTFWVTEPAIFVTVEFINCLHSRTYITENIEMIFNSVVCSLKKDLTPSHLP